jgi:magnesium transporter
MTSDIASPNIIDTEIVETLDEDNRLTRDYVDRVLDAVEDGNLNEVRRLVEPLHEADIADLLELTPSERRGELAISLGDLMSAEVLAEVNDYVREDIIDALPAAQVAGLAGLAGLAGFVRVARARAASHSANSLSLRWSRRICA